MDKTKLVDALKNVDAARSDKIGIAKGFWFTGTRIMAYNSEMALSVPYKTDYKGSIQETILPLLESSGAPEITFTENEEHLLVKAGSSKFKLQTNALEELTFRIPKMPEENSFLIQDAPEFLYALKACTRSLGNDVSEQEFKGVTFIAQKKTLHMFGWERITLTHAQVPTTGSMGFERVLIPTAVINQLLRITDGATELELHIDDKMVLCKCNGVTLWGRVEEQERNPRDFLKEVSNIKAQSNQMIKIDGDHFPKLAGMLDRACIITSAAVDVVKTVVTWEDGKMATVSKSSRGVADEIGSPSKKAGSHPDGTLKVDPERMRRGLDLTRMIMTEHAVIFANEEGTIHYFVSGD